MAVDRGRGPDAFCADFSKEEFKLVPAVLLTDIHKFFRHIVNEIVSVGSSLVVNGVIFSCIAAFPYVDISNIFAVENSCNPSYVCMNFIVIVIVSITDKKWAFGKHGTKTGRCPKNTMRKMVLLKVGILQETWKLKGLLKTV